MYLVRLRVYVYLCEYISAYIYKLKSVRVQTLGFAIDNSCRRPRLLLLERKTRKGCADSILRCAFSCVQGPPVRSLSLLFSLPRLRH